MLLGIFNICIKNNEWKITNYHEALLIITYQKVLSLKQTTECILE